MRQNVVAEFIRVCQVLRIVDLQGCLPGIGSGVGGACVEGGLVSPSVGNNAPVAGSVAGRHDSDVVYYCGKEIVLPSR